MHLFGHALDHDYYFDLPRTNAGTNAVPGVMEPDMNRIVASTPVKRDYDFVFLRQEEFGLVPEYVLRIVPKRKDKYLLRGQIWVDTSTFRIRRIEGVPAKSPSLWIKGIHITLQYAELGGMWVPISFDAIATVRFLGEYTLAGLNIQAPNPLSTSPNSHARTSGIVDQTETPAAMRLVP
jgi:hypothetical protein